MNTNKQSKFKEMIILALALFGVIFALSSTSRAMTLDEYLAHVQKQNKSFQAIEASKSAAADRFSQADLELSPVLTMKGSYLNDESLKTLSPGVQLTGTKVTEYSLGLAKKFSTGTQASVTANVQDIESKMETPALVESESGVGSVSLSLQQSLWKDFFGHGTRLRLERQAALSKLESRSVDIKAMQTLNEAEAAFWDLIYAQEDLQIRKDALERAKRIESWVARRRENGIADRADYLNAQGLTAARELQLLMAQNNLAAAEERVADVMELGSRSELPPLKGNLNQSRSIDSFFKGGKGRVIRIDSYLSVLEAEAKQAGALEAVDAIRPDLVLAGQYRTNGYDTNMSGAANKMTKSDYPTTAVSLTFTWLLDWETKGGVRNAAEQDALAARLTKERKLIESDTAWAEIRRIHAEMTKQIQAATKISEVQTAKAAAERDKLSRGRTLTSQVITAEQDAADAQLNLTKLKVEQRKLETQGRLFIDLEGGT